MLGYPLDGPYTATSARVRQRITLRGPDIYDSNTVTRDVFTVRAQVRSGNSGGPLVNPQGEVIGVVFGAAAEDTDTGFTLTADEVARRGRGRTRLRHRRQHRPLRRLSRECLRSLNGPKHSRGFGEELRQEFGGALRCFQVRVVADAGQHGQHRSRGPSQRCGRFDGVAAARTGPPAPCSCSTGTVLGLSTASVNRRPSPRNCARNAQR